MKFKFEANQTHQLDAIAAVVDLFAGQPKNTEPLRSNLSPAPALDNVEMLDIVTEVGAVGNNLVLDSESILQNLQLIQDRNGLEVTEDLLNGELDFDIEMETGTGKTYVYLRTVFEMAEKYNFTKFIILVPSIAIKEGVTSSIRIMASHFQELYAIPFDASVYSGSTAEEVQSFATSTNVQILVMTIDSLRGDKN